MGNKLQPRQAVFLNHYTRPDSATFSNCYQSAIAAGYTDKTARNLTHLNPKWLSEVIGQVTTIKPEEITQALTTVIYSDVEPTIVRLRAVELMMKCYGMMRQQHVTNMVAVTIDLTGSTPPT